MQYARIKSYRKDPNTNDIILISILTDEQGKPILDNSPANPSNIGTEQEIDVRLSQDGLQKLIREELPTEDKRIQEVLDKIHSIRTKCALNLETIAKEIEAINDESKKEFDKCVNKNDILKTRSLYLTKISLITQKRHLSRLAIQEESELGLQLAKLRKPSQSE
jgi:hypothetical protein